MRICRREIAIRVAPLARLLAAAGALLALGGAIGSARLYRNEAMRVRSFEPPPGWEMAPQQSYTRLLASYARAGGGRLTLSAQKVPAGITALALVEQGRPALERQGFADIHVQEEGGHVRLEALLEGSKRFVKQVYVVDAGLGFVITLIAPQASAPIMLRDFEDAVRSLQLAPPPTPAR